MEILAIRIVIAAEFELFHQLHQAKNIICFHSKQMTSEIGDNIIGSINLNNFPTLNQRDTVAAGSLVHIRGRYHHRNALMLNIFQDIPEFLTGYWIHASGRFIKEEQFRFVNQGTA